MYMAIVDLEKAFDRVPQNVFWWAMRKRFSLRMNCEPCSGNVRELQRCERVGEGLSDKFGERVGVH